MTYPFGADRTKLERAFELSSVQPASDLVRASEVRELNEYDLAVALFEHPDH